MGNTTASDQAQQRITQIQSHLQHEYQAFHAELSYLGPDAMQAESSSRNTRVTIAAALGITIGLFVLTLAWFLGILIIGTGIAIAYAVRLTSWDKRSLDLAIQDLNESIAHKALLRNNFPNSR